MWMGSAVGFFFILTTVLSLSSFKGEGMAFTADLSLDRDRSFSFLSLSLTSLSLTNLRWLLFLSSNFLMSCLVSPACSTRPHMPPSSGSMELRADGRSVRLSRTDMMRFLDDRERRDPSTPFSSSMHPLMTCSSLGREEMMVLAQLMPFFTVEFCTDPKCFWLCAERISLFRFKSLQLRLRFCLPSSGGVASTYMDDCYGKLLYKNSRLITSYPHRAYFFNSS